VESHWLHYSTHLLLNLTSRSPDYDRVLFEALTDCEYKEYNLDLAANQYSLGMMPLFSQSLSQNFDEAGSQLEADPTGAGGVRATQTTLFSNTQSALTAFGSGNPAFTWMELGPTFSQTGGERQARPTQKAAAPNIRRPTFSATPGTQSANAGAVVPSIGASTSGSTSAASSSGSTSGSTSGGNFAIPAPRGRRGMPGSRPSGATQSYYQHTAAHLRKQRKRETWHEKHRSVRRQNISMIRKYRTGELPDVQIKPSEILLPLQVGYCFVGDVSIYTLR
jgi:DNA-dependent protein kinase catalytic subunit